MEDRQIKEILIRDNTAFQDLNRQHQECDRKLEALKAGNMKTDREWVEEHNLKKQKLKLKDAMQEYILGYRNR
jgi:uncharacterized protein YdcH (DUF465 family)